MVNNYASRTAASGRKETQSDTAELSAVRRVADRFVQAYTLAEADPDFEQLFAESVQIWHSFDHRTVSLPGKEFAAAMLRMLHATAEIVRGHSDQVWLYKVDGAGFALAATASGELDCGIPVSIARSLWVTVEAGRITHIYEFGDLQQRTPLDEALRAAGRFRT